MEFLIFLYIILFIFGAMFGSFSSVLISRWKNKEWWILMGRSHCPKCHHQLSALELIPILSFVIQKWKCKNCHTKIPYIYPLLELSMGLSFALFGFAAIQIFHIPFPSIAFFFLLFFAFISIVYIFYDILYTEIPDQVYILYIVWFVLLFILWFFIDYKSLYYNAFQFPTFHTFIFDKIIGATVLYSFLFLQIFISWSLYFVKQKRYKEILELAFLYFLFPFITIWDFFKNFWKKNSLMNKEEVEEEIPLWVWPWDLFLAIIIGLTLGLQIGVIAFFLAYIIGSIISIFIIILTKKQARSQIPFWPFLWLWSFFAIFFTPQILTFIENYFLFIL